MFLEGTKSKAGRKQPTVLLMKLLLKGIDEMWHAHSPA